MLANNQRVVVFVIACVIQIVTNLVFAFSVNWTFVFLAGVQGVILYEIMSRTQGWLRWFTLPIYVAVYIVVQVITGNFIASILYDSFSFENLWQFGFAFSDPFFLITASIMTLSVFFIVSRRTISLPGVGRLGGQVMASDKVMLEISDDLVTRLLCASAITNGAAFRRKVLDRVENQYTAVAPEFGLDLELVAGVSQFVEHRETKFQIVFFVLGLVSMLLGIFSPLALLPMIVFTAPVMYMKIFKERFDLLKDFTNQDYDHEKVKSRYPVEQTFPVQGLPEPDQNLVIYGGFLPFVGAGFDLGGWSFAIDVSRPKNELGLSEPVHEFEIDELYSEIEAACAELGIPSLRIANLCFVNGLEIRNDKVILPEPTAKPVQHVDDDYLKSADDYRVRQYKHISVSAWGNDIIFSIFLRCTKKGKNLFVEAARYLLPPIDSQYRNLNQATNKSWSAILGIVLAALVLGPINGYIAGFILLGKYMSSVSRILGLQDRKTRNEIKNNSNFNYGVTTSFRQDVTGQFYLHYFQRADREMFVKILDNEILETLIGFLDDRNIDTSQLRERQTTILNSGIIVQGGNVEGQSIAVGQGAQSVTNQPSSPQRKE